MFGNILRLRKIILTFARFGLLVYLQRIPSFRRLIPRRLKQEAQLPEGLRKALETLGPTFIKIGQILSTRVDILPPEIINELSKLQDRVEPVPFEEVEGALKREMGEKYSRVESIHREPVASASLAQVHRGRIDGIDVVFKVKRPGVEKIIHQDLNILFYIARILSRFKETSWVKPIEIYREFREFILREMNFLNEGKTMKVIEKIIGREERIIIPEALEEFTTANLIVMEYIEGKKVSELENPEEIIEPLVECWMKQIFDIGVFHADPHPGNILVKDGRIVLVDFGLTGRLDTVTRQVLSSIVSAVIDMDTFHIYRVFYELGIIKSTFPVVEFELEAREMIDTYLNTPLEEIRILPLYQRISSTLRRMEVKLPGNLLLLGKTLVQIEGICRELKPDFVLGIHLKPYLEKMYLRSFLPLRAGRDISVIMRDTKEIIHSFPRIIYFFRALLERGRIPIEIEGLKETIQALEYAANTLAIGLIVAAVIIGSTFIMRPSPKFAPLGLIGYFIAGVFGVWFLYRIIRYRRF